MFASVSSSVRRCRALAAGTLALGVACARFGYETLDGQVPGEDGGAAASPPISGVGGDGGAASGGGGGGATLQGGAAGSGSSGLGGADGSPPGGSGGDGAGGSSDGSSGVDAGNGAPCAGPMTFAEPVALGGLPAQPLFGPALSADGLTLYFAASGDLFTARRASLADTTFESVEAIANVNSGVPELTPHVSRDGRTLYFARDTDGSGQFRELLQSQRASDADDFGAPTALTALNDPFWSELSPVLSADARELFFASSRPGGPGLYDIWHATRSSPSGAFNNPQPVPAINSAGDDSGLALLTDVSAGILSSNREGTRGGRDLWLVERPTRPRGNLSIRNIASLNSAQNDTDPALRADDAELLFASDRSGQSVLYSARRLCAP